LEDKKLHIKFPEDAIAANIALCPEDRKEEGIFPIRAVKENISVVVLRDLIKNGFIDRKAESDLAEKEIKHLNIRTPSALKPMGELSGGNQQK
jgi:ABC-type sugar transport system ATPase subunit